MALIIQGGTFADAAPCPECGSPIICQVAQAVHIGSLRWDVESNCGVCGSAIHQGGSGDAPPEVRDALFREHGKSRLSMNSEAPIPAMHLKAFREVFGKSLKETKVLVDEMRSAGIWSTYVEAEFIAGKLGAAGVEVLVEHGLEGSMNEYDVFGKQIK